MGGDAALGAKLQRAFHHDSALRVGSGIDETLTAYVGQAIAHLNGTSTSQMNPEGST